MELKIRIKEVKEERRLLTIEEQCMLSKSESTCGGLLTVLATDKLRKLGFVKIVESRDIGLFRTETIRDATDNEIRAWHCLRIVEKCYDSCAGCIKNRNHVSCTTFSDEIQANGLLFNKEVILEVTE